MTLNVITTLSLCTKHFLQMLFSLSLPNENASGSLERNHFPIKMVIV